MQRINIVKIQMVKEKSLLIENKKITNAQQVKEVVYQYLKGVDREHLVVLALDTKNKINCISTVSIGSLNSSIVHPREVFKVLIEANAGSFIVAHNHPSGDVTPSKEDVNITIRLKECGKLMGIELLDHIIIGDEESREYMSLKEKGVI